jgi:hypothetical protein
MALRRARDKHRRDLQPFRLASPRFTRSLSANHRPPFPGLSILTATFLKDNQTLLELQLSRLPLFERLMTMG